MPTPRCIDVRPRRHGNQILHGTSFNVPSSHRVLEFGDSRETIAFEGSDCFQTRVLHHMKRRFLGYGKRSLRSFLPKPSALTVTVGHAEAPSDWTHHNTCLLAWSTSAFRFTFQTVCSRQHKRCCHGKIPSCHRLALGKK